MQNDSAQFQFSEQIGHLLRRAYQRHVSIFQKAVPDAHLTAAQFVVLCTLRDSPNCDVADVAKATAIDEVSVRGILERLKWRELINARHEPGDTRHLDLSLTPAGATLVHDTVPFARQISEETFSDLTSDERSQLLNLLRRISGIGG